MLLASRSSDRPHRRRLTTRGLRAMELEGRDVPSGFGPLGTPTNLGSVVNSPFLDQRGTISKDGLSLYFGSNRPGSVGTIEGSDLYVTQRASVNDPWGPPRKVEALSSAWDDNAPTFSPDGHWVYFGSDRLGGSGGYDIWAAHRQNKDDDFGWETPVNLGPIINSDQHDDGPTYFQDENGAVSLYFTSQRLGGQGDYDIYISHATADDHVSFGPATNVAELNSPRRDTRTTIRRDGLEFFLTSTRVGSVPDATGAPSLDIWVATRASTADPWSAPVNLGAPINTAAADGAPSLSSDGTTLYFDSTRTGGFGSRDLYVSSRERLGEETYLSGASFSRVARSPIAPPDMSAGVSVAPTRPTHPGHGASKPPAAGVIRMPRRIAPRATLPVEHPAGHQLNPDVAPAPAVVTGASVLGVEDAWTR
jgi:WD40-like Beta Propeller Repeat